jgi:porin
MRKILQKEIKRMKDAAPLDSGLRRYFGASKRLSIRPLLSLILMVLVAANAQAETAEATAEQAEEDALTATAPADQSAGILPVPDYGGDIWNRSYLTGDWGGKRTEWANKGIQYESEIMQYGQKVTSGGIDKTAAWGGKINYMLHLDLQKMGVMPGGLIYVRFDGRWGRSSTGRTGQLLPANEASLIPVDFDDLERETWGTLTALNYTQFLSEKFAVFLGQIDMMDGDPNEFAGGRGDTQFMNYNFIYAAPTAIVPASTLGAGGMFMPNKNVTIASQVVSATDSSFSNGFDTLDDGHIWTTSLMTQYRLGELPGGFNATYLKWFDTDFTDIKSIYDLPGEGIISSTKDSSWLVALSAWQYLYTEETSKGPLNLWNKKPDLQGVGLFARIGLADKDTNPMHNNYSVGIGGRGSIPGRDNDAWGVGYFYTDLDPDVIASSLVGIKDDFQGAEVFYSLAITPAAKLTFDVQFLESSFKGIDDATVAGVRFQMIF